MKLPLSSDLGLCDFIVTYNKADFEAARGFGIPLVTAKEFLEKIGELT